MKKKIPLKLKLLLFVLSIAGISFTILALIFSIQTSFANPDTLPSSDGNNNQVAVPVKFAQTLNSTIQNSVGLPVRFKIPKIKVDAPVEQVGLASDGSMGVPINPMNTGWYKLGPRPGEVGSAVIAGHVNWWSGAKGAFENLKDLNVGDLVTIQNDKGEVISFMVREIRSFDAGADADEVFNSTDGKSHLNLVTCEGVWIKSVGQYSSRLVVFTDRVTIKPTTPTGEAAIALRARVQGRILLQTEKNGEAWYVNPTNGLRYYMKDGPTAYSMMRKFGLGISNADLIRLQAGDKGLINRLRGRILLQVENHGEAYYVHPEDGVARYMANGEAAYSLMRSYSLGITDADLVAIPVGAI